MIGVKNLQKKEKFDRYILRVFFMQISEADHLHIASAE